MIAVDTNILVYAHRAECPLHKRAKRRLTSLVETEHFFGLPAPCLAEFIRVVTHPVIFSPPSTLEQAFAVIDGLLASPTARLLVPTAEHANTLREVAIAADARGNLVFDAQIAAICLENGVRRLLTADQDFKRFAPILEVEAL